MDRLLRYADEVAADYSSCEFLAQTGDTRYMAQHIKLLPWLDSVEFERLVSTCDVFVSHAGMGNILLAAQYQKPIVVVPRQAELGEHINNHQVATADTLKNRSFIYVASTAGELGQFIRHILDTQKDDQNFIQANRHRGDLVNAIRGFIDDGKR